MNKNIQGDFQICISVPLRLLTVIISLSLETKKKLNSFIYNAIAKHCLVIKLGEPKSDQKSFAR